MGGSAPHSHSLNLPLPSEMGEKTEKTKIDHKVEIKLFTEVEKRERNILICIYTYI